MRTTIDGAGRVVLPKAAREAMRLRAGQEIEIVVVDGHIEIDVVPTPVTVSPRRRIAVAEPDGSTVPLTAAAVREALEGARR